jgi:DNA-binding NarL/FixJ family response regulator
MQANSGVKVIVFTAINDPEIRQRCFEVGASAFVSKWAGAQDLLSAVKRVYGDGRFPTT